MKPFIISLVLSFFLANPFLNAAENPDQVVAEVYGQKITAGDINKAAGADLYQLKKRMYELKKKTIEEKIDEKILEKEAARKKMTKEALIEKYVTKRSKKVSKKAINKFYKENKAQLRGTKDQYTERIKSFLRAENERKAYKKYVGGLKKRARAKIYLKKPERYRVKLQLTEAPRYGKKSAKVEIVEFSDFDCTYCSKLSDSLDKISKKYGRKVSRVFKAFPLARHKDAPLAHQASLCADDQKKFWPFHKKLFKNQGKLQRSNLETYAKAVKLDMTKFLQCLDSGEKAAQVQKDMAEGTEAGVRSTPTLFVNGQMVVGAVPQQELEEIINEELKRK